MIYEGHAFLLHRYGMTCTENICEYFSKIW